MKYGAFTILELLVIIATIFIVLALMLPVYYNVQRGTYRGSCMTNEEQLGRAIFLYSQDSDGCLPNIADAPGGKMTWRRRVSRDIHSPATYLCPTRQDHALGPDGFYRSYAANYNDASHNGKDALGNGAFAGAGSKPLYLKAIPQPSQLIMLCEFSGGNTPEFNIDDAVHFGPDTHLLWAGHSGGSDYFFADGHVKWLKPLDTKDLWHRDASVPLSPNGMAVLAETGKRARR